MKNVIKLLGVSTKPTLKQGTVLVVLFLYAGLQSIMAFCPAQFLMENELAFQYRINECVADEVPRTSILVKKSADSHDNHCLISNDAANTPISFKALGPIQDATAIIISRVDFEAIQSFSKITELLNSLPLHDISNSLLSQKTAFLFYH